MTRPTKLAGIRLKKADGEFDDIFWHRLRRRLMEGRNHGRFHISKVWNKESIPDFSAALKRRRFSRR
jgi:hypothetical protein